MYLEQVQIQICCFVHDNYEVEDTVHLHCIVNLKMHTKLFEYLSKLIHPNFPN